MIGIHHAGMIPNLGRVVSDAKPTGAQGIVIERDWPVRALELSPRAGLQWYEMAISALPSPFLNILAK
jgi:hypothetical protein